jgi:hypothetical protein
MEYPGSKITKPLRQIILIFFLVVFFLLAPAIIMYMSGYRYDWSRGLLRETGAINIDIEPRSAAVLINGTKIKSKIPIRLNDRIPGKYKIEVTAPEYYDWQKEVEVKNKQTVYIKEVAMLRRNSPSLIVEGAISDIELSFDGRYLSYIKQTDGNIREVRIRNLNTNEDTSLAAMPAGKNAKIAWSPKNYFITVSETEAPYNTLLIFDAQEPAKKIDIIARTRSSVDKYQWKETIQPELYYSANKRLMSFVPTTEQRYSLANNTWLDWYMENGQLWTLQAVTSTKKIKLVRDTLGFSEDFTAENFFSPTEQQLAILTAYDGQVLLKKIGQPEMIIVTGNNKFNLAGEKFKISPYNSWWLIWTPWEIWTYSKNEEPNLLNRSGEGLKQVEPLDRFNTLALVWNDKVTALYPYYLVTHDLLNNSLESVAADSVNKILFFSGKIGDREGLWQLGY